MNRSMMSLILCCALAAPLAAQQTQAAATEPAVTAAVAVTPSVEPAPAPGPRIAETPRRVEATFKATTSTAVRSQDNVEISRSPLIYILVAAVLVVLLVFLIKRA